ncbi:MAG: amidohydrolase family protein [Dehalococcoidia bacterium]
MPILHNMKLIDMVSERVQTGKAVIVDGNKIAEIRGDGLPHDPSRRDFIDMQGYYLLPGIFDLHSHVTIPFMKDIKLSILPTILRQVQKNLRNCVEGGVTTVRDLAAIPNSVRSYQKNINAGKTIGPRIIYAGSIIVCPGGVPEVAPYFKGIKRAILGGQFAERPVTPEDVRRCVQLMVKQGAEWIKTTHGDKSLMMGWDKIPYFSDECYQALVGESRKAGKKIAMHHTSATGFRKALQFKVDTLEHVALDELSDKDISTFVEQGVAIIPTLMALAEYSQLDDVRHMLDKKGDYYLEKEPYQYTSDLVNKFIQGVTEEDCSKEYYYDYKCIQKQFPVALENVRRLHKAGAVIGLGTDIGGTDFGFFGLTYKELGHLVAAGMSNFEALKTATITSARIIGLDSKLGSIETGKLADFILVEGNPLDDVGLLKNVKMVWKNGEIVYNRL